MWKHTFNDKPRHVVLLVNEGLLEGHFPPATEGEEKILDPLTAFRGEFIQNSTEDPDFGQVLPTTFTSSCRVPLGI